MMRGALPSGILLLLLAGAAAAQDEAPAETSCTTCHGDADLFDEAADILRAAMAEDVHLSVGLSCHDCHGGNPDPALADDPDAAMDADWAPNPYVGAPATREIPAFCGRCHSDPRMMRRFNPAARVDQEQEYRSSHHGVALAAGDESVATCVSCHGNHGIRRPSSPSSRVYPTRVAETCGGCHSDPERMAGRTLADGRPLPIDQRARWQRSVHARALLERGDLSAPTCNDCHGNHGATPPGVESVTFVCGQCHGREAQIFRASPKHAGFEEHREFLAEAGEEGCAMCHDEPAAGQGHGQRLSECTSCHENHGIVRPSVAIFAALPETPCEFCHGEVVGVAGTGEPQGVLTRFAQTSERLVGEGRAAGLDGDALFDWLVDRAVELPQHSLAGDPESGRKPEFGRLFDKFRIGKTHYTYVDPASGDEVKAAIVRCSDCHESAGSEDGIDSALIGGMRDLTSRIGRAQRMLVAARRGGVETRAALSSLEQAVDAQIELEVLVHSFSTAADGPFLGKHAEGVAYADEAQLHGSEALDELTFRRRGLAASLVVITLVLIALGWKIRDTSHREAIQHLSEEAERLKRTELD